VGEFWLQYALEYQSNFQEPPQRDGKDAARFDGNLHVTRSSTVSLFSFISLKYPTALLVLLHHHHATVSRSSEQISVEG